MTSPSPGCVITHFADEEIEAQEGKAVCPVPQPQLSSVWLWDAAEEAWEPRGAFPAPHPHPTGTRRPAGGALMGGGRLGVRGTVQSNSGVSVSVPRAGDAVLSGD